MFFYCHHGKNMKAPATQHLGTPSPACPCRLLGGISFLHDPAWGGNRGHFSPNPSGGWGIALPPASFRCNCLPCGTCSPCFIGGNNKAFPPAAKPLFSGVAVLLVAGLHETKRPIPFQACFAWGRKRGRVAQQKPTGPRLPSTPLTQPHLGNIYFTYSPSARAIANNRGFSLYTTNTVLGGFHHRAFRPA